MALAQVTRIPNYAEAQIAAGALRSAGIAAEVFDGNFGQVEAPVIQSLGGLRIMAPEEDVAAARELLRTLRRNPLPRDPDDASPWDLGVSSSPSQPLRRRGMRLLAAILLGVPLLIWLIRLAMR